MRRINDNNAFRYTPVVLLTIVVTLLLPVAVSADSLQTTNASCDFSAQQAQLPIIERPPGLKPDATHIDADKVTSVNNDNYSFRGNVSLFRNELSVSADVLNYIKSAQTVDASGTVTLSRQDANFVSERLFYNVQQGTGKLEQVEFIFPQKHARGSAQRLLIPEKNIHKLYSTSYTTCEGEAPAWQLRSQLLDLNNNTNIGTAHNVWVEFMNVPIFYMPYLSFPLSGRKTGLLVPTFGSSSQLGTKITVPYYLNIAPDLDATLTLDNFTRRGQRLSGELRFLNQHDHGQIIAEYLPDDDVLADDREYVHFTHQSSLFDALSTKLEYRRVSDIDYFEDFATGLETINISHLESRAEATYRGAGWMLQGRIIEFQTLDEDIPDISRPYKVRPSIAFQYAPLRGNWPLQPQLTADYINFERQGRVAGGRLNIEPSISLPLEADAGFVKPAIHFQHTRYQLQDHAATLEDDPHISVPVYSIDSGLFFERKLDVAGKSLLQTLEPRLFYVNIPFREQSGLIIDQNNVERVFDTALASQSFNQMFSTNRFNGGDRIGDTRQVSVALTTRFLDSQSGVEKLSASIGRIRYFQDREVTLPGGLVETRDFSDIFAELRARPTPYLSTNTNIQWDSHVDEARTARFQLQYNKPGARILNLTYLINRDGLGETSAEEWDISVFWPISHNWNLIGRRNYNLHASRTEELLGGLEYNNCCWAFRVVARRSVTDVTSVGGIDSIDHDRSILFQFELKGLTAIGKDVKSLLQNREYGVSGF